ncbi:hypothetical protein MCOR29_010084 [Pyricularia oryzae]|nr:hypothetical protein MCOR19_003821 [Pyricularia oryzae]KAI6274164.1 hypothetical protein MCOR26_006626 [Pyricularia oryzae]KAI6306541.1 hypothetical protein MCOR29_010084 [Pyricularia oryzae]KAI6398262.1 hypothetical protein MCOR23_005827 [Pyricularia oryzae]KAI6415345.1 hypothetical protein MCOR20_001677 [Pyricularia oryzae]
MPRLDTAGWVLRTKVTESRRKEQYEEKKRQEKNKILNNKVNRKMRKEKDSGFSRSGLMFNQKIWAMAGPGKYFVEVLPCDPCKVDEKGRILQMRE